MNVPIVAGDIDDDGYKPRFVRVSIAALPYIRFFFLYRIQNERSDGKSVNIPNILAAAGVISHAECNYKLLCNLLISIRGSIFIV